MDEPLARWPSAPPGSETPTTHEAQMHALRTPLTAVILRVNLLRRRLRDSDQHRQLDDDLARIEAGLAQLVAAITAIDTIERDAKDDDTRGNELGQ